MFNEGEKAKIISKPMSEFDFEHEFRCEECDKNFENEVAYENHNKLKCCMCDACGRCNCLN